jgi:chromosome segregation ATPase
LSYDETVTTNELVDESLKNLQLLEDRVRSCVDELRMMRESSRSLTAEHAELEKQVREYDAKLQQLGNWEREREGLQAENRTLREKISHIEDRIKGILSRLETALPRE